MPEISEKYPVEADKNPVDQTPKVGTPEDSSERSCERSHDDVGCIEILGFRATVIQLTRWKKDDRKPYFLWKSRIL